MADAMAEKFRYPTNGLTTSFFYAIIWPWFRGHFIDDEHELCWWTIYSWEDGGIAARLEKRGYKGFCVVNETPFERKRMLSWVRSKPKGTVHGTRPEKVKRHLTEFGEYAAVCRCFWMRADCVDEFNELLKNIPQRKHLFITSNLGFVKSMLRGLNYVVYSVTYVNYYDDRKDDVLVSVQDNPRIDTMKTLAAVTRAPKL